MRNLLFLIILLLTINVKAQFKISSEIRPRTEYNHGYKSLAAKDQVRSLYTAQRTRLNFSYINNNLKTKLVFQDVRIWGNQTQLVKNEDFATSIHEAWADVNIIENVSLKFGRQQVIYDDHRIFGSVGWAHQARSHDMAILKYENNLKIHLGLAYNEDGIINSNLYSTNNYKSLQFIWTNFADDNKNISILALNNGIPFIDNNLDQIIKYSQTIGTHTWIKFGELKPYLNVYYQFGKDANDNDLSAHNVNIGLKTKLTNKILIDLGFEKLSGTDQNTTSAENNSFTPFYGTNHKFNGWMDYFYVGNHVNSVGLRDIYLNVTTKMDKFSFTIYPHIFISDAVIINPNDNSEMKNYLGTEVDISCGYKLNDEVVFKAGYSQMFATETMQALKGGDKNELQNWAWIMISIKPTFFKSN